MAGDDVYLRVAFDSPNKDMRTFTVYQVVEGGADIRLYRFYHPMDPSSGLNVNNGITTFHRTNLTTNMLETAGQIEWRSQTNLTVYFGGIEEGISIRDIRLKKKDSSASRRFQAKGSEYKWKIGDNGNDLICTDWLGRTVASWTHETSILHVLSRVESVLDRFVVTFFLNLWFKLRDDW
ncbi:hypothetical protein PLICRDRAFT_48312 [Plicaturopsis crispa FD-325 SS-3]|nr:hypothetical protein PLICRDRAFT_48312 [Plicaturopsis crispa FD-325 SS-3]